MGKLHSSSVFSLLSYSSLLSSAGASVLSWSAGVTMLQHIVAICTVGYITIVCSQSVRTFPCNKKVCNHQPGPCRPVRGVDKGSEDIQVLPNGLALITSGFDAQDRGNILLFDLKKPRRGAHALDIVGDLDRSTFSPLGLSIWRNYKSNVIYIFVVNRRADNTNTVEKFRFEEKKRKLCYLRTYCDPTITHLNSIVATGEDSFYFTNYYKCDLRVEYLNRLSLGNVGFYDGSRGHIVLAGRNIPNGINISPDGKYVYLAETGGKRLSVFIRECDNTLTLTQVVPLGTSAGNIDVDMVTGHLWVSAYPDALMLLNYLSPPHIGCPPSQVLRLTMSEDSKVTGIVEVYYNDGRQIAASSVAVHYGRYMLIGSVHTKMLLCEPTVQTATMCCHMVTSVDELGTNAPPDDSNDELDNKPETATTSRTAAEVAGGVVERSVIKQSRCCGDIFIEPSGGGNVCIKSYQHLQKQYFETGGSHVYTHAMCKGTYYVSC
ncbi:Serum paraoxonase/arylesterase 1 [Lamellibrachia satsuma]|nr:Serum paraoxonase/arylesterase 1 [Lamellibrachia satsuma]